jgi:hypothetical protein
MEREKRGEKREKEEKKEVLTKNTKKALTAAIERDYPHQQKQEDDEHVAATRMHDLYSLLKARIYFGRQAYFDTLGRERESASER